MKKSLKKPVKVEKTTVLYSEFGATLICCV